MYNVCNASSYVKQALYTHLLLAVVKQYSVFVTALDCIGLAPTSHSAWKYLPHDHTVTGSRQTEVQPSRPDAALVVSSLK